MAKSTTTSKQLAHSLAWIPKEFLDKSGKGGVLASAVDLLIELLLADEDVFAKYVLAHRTTEPIDSRKVAERRAVLDQFLSFWNPEGQKGKSRDAEPSAPLARSRLNEI